MSQPASQKTQTHRLAGILLAVVAGALAPATTQASPTTQAVTDNGTFLPYTRPPAQRAGLCLVDTGVDENPSTENAVVDRVALDNGTGNDVSPTSHGTVLAMLAAAPENGWGMTGTAPNSIQIVSVRILEPGQTTFPFRFYEAGITRCLELRNQYDIRVINLSLGTSSAPTSEAYEAVGNAIERATEEGVAVVAAAGNDDGGPVGYPAAYPAVLSVGATSTTTSELCSFSNRGPELRMTAPGCQLDSANPTTGEPVYNYWQGTSDASEIAASALTALETYDPTLTPQAAEHDLTAADNGALDIAQSFIDAGLGQLVTEAQAAQPPTMLSTQSTTTTARTPTSPSPPEPSEDLPTSTSVIDTPVLSPPRARVQRDGTRITITLQNRPPNTQTKVRYLAHRPHTHQLRVLKTLTGTFTTLHITGHRVAEIQMRYQTQTAPPTSSPWTTLTLPSTPTKILRSR